MSADDRGRITEQGQEVLAKVEKTTDRLSAQPLYRDRGRGNPVLFRSHPTARPRRTRRVAGTVSDRSAECG
jgi:hypothetical protein